MSITENTSQDLFDFLFTGNELDFQKD